MFEENGSYVDNTTEDSTTDRTNQKQFFIY